jgi:thiamine pyrophosphokinase
MTRSTSGVHALVVAAGDVPAREALDGAWPRWDESVSLVVAADGGARNAEDLGLHPDVLVGDADSLDPADVRGLQARGVELRLQPADKDASDTELALLEAEARGASRITVLGALGGLRMDHALANVLLLSRSGVEAVVSLLDGSSRLRSLRAEGDVEALDLDVTVGDLVSLFALGEASGVTTRGLRYPLAEEALLQGSSRGLSNEISEVPAQVSLRRGRLLIVETRRAS